MVTDSDTTAADNVHPFPSPALEPHPEAGERSKDSTSALRAKRYRRARKRDAKRDGRKAVQQPNRDGESAPDGQALQTKKQNEIRSSVTVHAPPPLASNTDARAPALRHGRGIRFVTLMAALALATVSGGFSIYGMTSIFVGAYWPVVGMGVALEVGKLSAVAALPTLRRGGLKGALAALVLVPDGPQRHRLLRLPGEGAYRAPGRR